MVLNFDQKKFLTYKSYLNYGLQISLLNDEKF